MRRVDRVLGAARDQPGAGLVDHRADVGGFVERVAARRFRGRPGDPRGELVGDRRDRDDALDRGAPLARVLERAADGELGRLIEIGVGEHEQRVVAAQLEHGAPVTQPGGDRLAHRDSAGERDHLDGRVAEKRVEYLPGVAAHDPHVVVREPGVGEDLRQPDRAQRRPLGGFEDDRRPGRDRLRDFVRDLAQRMVEGGDRGNQADGEAEGVGAAVAAVGRDVAGEHLAVVAQRLHGRESEHVDRAPPRVACPSGTGPTRA